MPRKPAFPGKARAAARLQARLVVRGGTLRGQEFLLPATEEVQIGRDADCLVRIAERKVSRCHAVLLPTREGFFIRDEGSRNGTYVNGARVSRRRLCDGDTITIGECSLSYRADVDDPLVGETVAGYRIEKRLGRGGMGTVYAAMQIAMERRVALKLLSEELSEDADFIARFVREARSMAELSHPHVVQVHNVGQHEKLFYLSMEYMEGGSVAQLVDQKGPQPPRRALSLILDATRALMWAEQNRIVHRDIKPDNLLLDGEGKVKVGDFGLAANLGRTKALREGGRVMGTPRYMAPEQAVGKAVDHRADIYALGGTLYTVLSGVAPFEGRNRKEIVSRKLRQRPPSLGSLNLDVPAQLSDVVDRMLARRPNDRYQSAEEVYRDLSAVLEAPEERRKSASAGRRHLRRRLLRSRRRRAAPVSFVVALILGVPVLLWLFFESRRFPGGETPVRNRESASSPVVVSPPASVDDDTAPPPTRTPQNPTVVSAPGDPERVTIPRAAVAAFEALRDEVRLLTLECRFQDARERLSSFEEEHPAIAPKVQVEMERVLAEQKWISARTDAMEREERGDEENAREVLTGVVDSLPERLKEEARLAIESLEKKLQERGGTAPAR